MASRFNISQLAGKQHHHGCEGCRRRYCCACETPEVDSTCGSCASGRPSASLRPWEPAACCLAAEPLKPLRYAEDLRSYKLAGPGPWFKCPTCARTFPCQPGKVNVA